MPDLIFSSSADHVEVDFVSRPVRVPMLELCTHNVDYAVLYA